MHHMFDTEHARLYGLEEAVLINNLKFWIVRNRANGENFRRTAHGPTTPSMRSRNSSRTCRATASVARSRAS